MAKWLIVIMSLVILVVLFGVFVKQKVGDIRPAFLPSISAPTKTQPVVSTNTKIAGETVPFQLNLPEGLQIIRVAKDLGKVRDLQFSPNGVLLASINENPGKVLVIADKNGLLKEPKVLISNLNNPHGLAFHPSTGASSAYNDKLYISQIDQVDRYSFDENNLTATFEKKLFDLPNNKDDHITRTLAFDDNGNLYTSVGSTCNVCREGNSQNATVLISDAEGNNLRVFAKGLRNAVFLKFDPTNKQLLATENSRDLLGDNIPPDEIDILKSNGDYGWPFCYGDKILDTTFDAGYKDCSKTETPAFQIQAHSAPLGLTIINSDQLPKEWQGDLLVSYHGSWNRSVPTGYKIVRLTRKGENITSQEDFITGFLSGSSAFGRPVDLEFSPDGTLFISDDKSGSIYAVIKK